MIEVSIKGNAKVLRSITINPTILVAIKGRFLKIGEIVDEHWIPYNQMLSLPEIIKELDSHPDRLDIIKYTQKIPHIDSQYNFPHEWTNLAVAHFSSYREWFDCQVDRMVKKGIRKATKEGIRTCVAPFDDSLIKGIQSIYNEIPIRQGKKFWHYGKGFSSVKKENSTYLDRSIFIGAFYENELVGFIKLVIDGEVASIMQILSKYSYFAKRPNNALISKAIEICEERQVKYLIYGRYTYGKVKQSSLIEFKKNLGFHKIDIPIYYVPLTLLGKIGLKMRLHHELAQLIPAFLITKLIQIRNRLNNAS